MAGTTGIEGASAGTDVVGKISSVTFDVNANGGADGLQSISYNLAQIQAQNAGLKAIDKTVDGATISFSIEGGTGDIIGKINDAGAGALNGTVVLRVHATDADTFQVTELSPLFHTGQGEDGDLDFKVVLDVTDKDGDSVQTTATVKIDDDMPDANPQSGTADAQPRMNTNLLLVLDDSGSMAEATSLTNTNKLQALKAAVNELFEQYGNLGTVKVCFTRFDSSASTLTSGGNVWLTLEQAKALLNDPALTASGNTNYDAALLQAIASYITNTGTDHKLTGADVTGPIQNVGYFISDGQPNDNNDWSSDPYKVPGWVAPASGAGVGASNGGAIDTEEEYLQYFLNQEDIKMYSIGIGDGINTTAADNLKRISYDGTGAGTNDDANLYIELKDLSQLTQTLVGTVVVPVGGSVANYGADGGFVSQITFPGGFSATRNQTTGVITVVNGGGATGTVNPGGSPIPGGADVVRVTLASGSALFMNMLTGAWQYVPAAGDSATYNFGFTLTDYDGDTDSDTLSVSTTVGGFKPIVRDDAVITNIAGAFSVSDKALLWNDTEKDAGQTIAISANQADLTNIVAVGSATRDAINSEIDLTAAAVSFTYKGSSIDGSDTGNVTITRVGGNTLTGDGLDNIIIGGSGDDTLLGFQGNDVLIGGAGNDILQAGAGNDYVDGGAGTNDILDYSDISGNWNFTLDPTGNGTATVAGTDTYLGIEGVTGGSGNNVITGNASNNVLSGGGGDDTLSGGGGTDTLNGDAGNDTLIYGNSASTYNGGSNTSNALSDTNAGDRLDISGVASLDLTSISNTQFSGLETIHMIGGGNQALTLNSQDVIDLGSGTFNPSGAFPSLDTVRIDGDAGDVVNLSKGTGEWVNINASISNEPAGYTVWAFDPVAGGGAGTGTVTAYVIVDNDITVNVV